MWFYVYVEYIVIIVHDTREGEEKYLIVVE